MSAASHAAAVPPAPTHNYLAEHTIASWLFTKDHKRIGIMYLIATTVFFFVGALTAGIVRLELLTPQGDLLYSPDSYNRMFTAHGVVMVFFFLIPAIPSVIGNFVLPMMIGARDLAFPRINLASFYLYMVAGTIGTLVLILGGVDTGWTFYTPFSTMFSNSLVVPAATAGFIAGFSSIFTALNFIVTVHTMRCPGMTWTRLPLFVWSHYATALIIILGTPVLAIALALIIAERSLGVGIFDPSVGGDPVLFQHLFWFYSHPAVYIMILPAMGIISEIIPCFSRRMIFGYHFVAFASLGIAVIGFLVWGHHMFVSGQSMYAGMVFSFITFLVAVPSAIKVFNWTATMYKGTITFETPMLYALGFMGLFIVGGLTGIMLGTLGIDIQVHDTYFVVGHFHYIMVGGTVMAYMGGLHYWWPKMTGRMYPDLWGKLSALLVFVGFNLTFFPQFILGYLGMPRRYYEYPPEFQVLNVLSTAGATVLAVGYILPVVYFLISLKNGALAGDNPWRATGLEWQSSSPPPHENFLVTPVVHEEPYNYTPEGEGYTDADPVFVGKGEPEITDPSHPAGGIL